ncbi:hypothetical protein CDAR_55471 [Caerostris darwini]|uniref:Uncharacterized protein n=1 Tax=Caerostris darwini TaxID=1538125 RepID=A0AAV4U241_9ARAC|nr:hypothetical protein CDAR_55471 [Caerostris darwini]
MTARERDSPKFFSPFHFTLPRIVSENAYVLIFHPPTHPGFYSFLAAVPSNPIDSTLFPLMVSFFGPQKKKVGVWGREETFQQLPDRKNRALLFGYMRANNGSAF